MRLKNTLKDLNYFLGEGNYKGLIKHIFELEFKIMEIILIKAPKKSDSVLLLSLAKKLGMSAKSLTKEEIKDWELAQKIEAGMKSPDVSRNEVLKVLRK